MGKLIEYFDTVNNLTVTIQIIAKESTPWMKAMLGVGIPAIVLNFILVVVTLSVRRFRTSPTLWYINQLAIAQLCLAVSLILNFVEELNSAWTFSVGLCKAKEGANMVGVYGSALFVLIISADRYTATHTNKSQLRTPSAVIIISIIAWLIAVIVSSPAFRYADIIGLNPLCKCRHNWGPQPTKKERCEQMGYSALFMCPFPAVSPTSSACFEWIVEDHTVPSFEELYEELYDLNLDDYYEGFGLDDLFEDSTTPSALYLDYSYQNTNMTSNSVPSQCQLWSQPLSFKAYLVFNFVGMLLVPVLIAIFIFIATAVQTHQNRAKMNNTFLLNIMSLVLSILLLCFWFPYHVVQMLRISAGLNFQGCENLPGIVSMVGHAFSFVFPLVVFCFVIAFEILRKRNEEDSKPVFEMD